MKPRQPFLLAILDGWGYKNSNGSNAVKIAKTPVIDGLMNEYPWTTLSASGENVGLPAGQMGNSEVGHLNIGAGRIVFQDFQRINKEIESGSFFKNQALLEAMKKVVKRNGTLHLMGLLSDGGVHSHINHLFALIDMAKETGVERVVTHPFLDGRDVPPRSAGRYVRMLEEKVNQSGLGKIRTIQGRYYAMDRDNRWDRISLSYGSIAKGKGRKAESALEAIDLSYNEGVDDEFLIPTVVGEPEAMEERDSVIFFNFRSDRTRQLTKAFIEKDFHQFNRGRNPVFPYFVTMTQYDDEFNVPVAYSPEIPKNTLADVLSQNGLKQLHIAETEKYAHVTFFLNGGVEEPKPGEERILIPSPKVKTYDLKPEMSAYEVGRETAKSVRSGKYDFIVVNFANCDMVGHTGNLEAAVRAVEAVDENVGIVLDSVLDVRGQAFITADHGNAEIMKNNSEPVTAHTTSPVMFISVTAKRKELRKGGSLGDIAPTILEVMDIRKPNEMTGVSLFAVK
ncbi:MAG: 2,3-bisphosphoglycerate-independent phosphoglycerate mutase [Actinomycetota bacterium]|nr:2,3-bisphosphoglycerate-independent phosphoglycerate mutase [Actinomycetota bacterium]